MFQTFDERPCTTIRLALALESRLHLLLDARDMAAGKLGHPRPRHRIPLRIE